MGMKGEKADRYGRQRQRSREHTDDGILIKEETARNAMKTAAVLGVYQLS